MLMGAKEVHGIDIMETRLGTFRQMIQDFQFASLFPHLASVEQVPYPDNFFDLVLSNEAISHYHDVDGFLRESARVLKPVGYSSSLMEITARTHGSEKKQSKYGNDMKTVPLA